MDRCVRAPANLLPDESIFEAARLCVVGNINRDIKTAPLRGGDYLFADGETTVAGFEETIGGGGANSAAIAARLKAKVSFLGQIGQGTLGKRLEQAMIRSGVRCYLHKSSLVSTGTTVNLVYQSGARHFLSCHPNNEELSFAHLDLAALRRADHLLRADVWFSESMLYGGNEKLFRRARKAGLAVSIDLNWDPKWNHAGAKEVRRRKEVIRQLLPMVDLAHGNVRELNEFADADSLAASLDRLEQWGVGAVVVHMGAKGSGYYTDRNLVVEKAVQTRKQVRVTGSGDVLSVCMMLMHHREDFSARDKLQLANTIVAGFIEGRRPLIPSLED